MGNRSSYRTRQREEILDFLKCREGSHVTAAGLHEEMNRAGIRIGLTTVYRTLDKMADAGDVQKYRIEGVSSACYEYLGEGNREEHGEYHCKCEKCGRLIHLHCEEVEALRNHIAAEHGFTMDTGRTVFYGICGECRKGREE
ncbi:Fur family transcriptional regulator [Eubacterium pyruvativorans]|uniref:Fur family transcriptional regulator n=1 Tax=Eubacterium pyruvativorans TaxID=155865 RepID=UPI0023F285FB|nr:transcriptional repressor [Eubacterium pyruvativorans]MCI5747285.1 transcriptional repressor [Eubacterium pyruvativorans]MDD7684360.1 transcriptional repressor [Eubacterium pyruvativorans]